MMDIGNRLNFQFTDMQGHMIHQWYLFTQLLNIILLVVFSGFAIRNFKQ